MEDKGFEKIKILSIIIHERGFCLPLRDEGALFFFFFYSRLALVVETLCATIYTLLAV